MAAAIGSSVSLPQTSADREHGLLYRAFLAILEARQRQADREIAAILARRGGIVVDVASSRTSELRRQGRLPALGRR